MAGLGPFDYIVKEAEESFFQDAAEGIAKTASEGKLSYISRLLSKGGTRARSELLKETQRANAAAPRLGKSQLAQLKAEAGLSEESVDVARAIADAAKGGHHGHGGPLAKTAKLVVLMRKSNELGLTKQASDQYSGEWSSYDDLLNIIASAAKDEPQGMMKSAARFIREMQSIVGDSDTLEKVGHTVLVDAALADAINGGMSKEAVGRIRGLLAGAGAFFSKAPWRALAAKSTKTVGSHGLAETVLHRPRTFAEPIRSAYRATRAGVAGDRAAHAAKNIEELSARQETLRKSMAAMGEDPTKARMVSRMSTQLGDVEKQLARQQARHSKSTEALSKMRQSTGHDYVQNAPKPPKTPEPPKASTNAGGREAEQAASKAKESAGATDKAPGMKPDLNDFNPKMREDAYKAYDQAKASGRNMSSKDASPPPGYEEWKASGKGRTSGKSNDPGYTNRADKSAPGAPSPESPPKGVTPEAVAEKPGFGQIYEKWSKDGWASLSDAEKRKVYVGAGAAFVAQRAVMDKPIV